jgi:DUF1009 family protein
MMGPADRIGIIAGSGSLPREVAESIVGRGGGVHVVMVDGWADASLAMFPHTVVNWAQPGRATSALRRAGIRDVVMLGGFQRPRFQSARPDFAFFQVLPAVTRLLKAGGDDAVLRGLVALFEKRGLNVVGVADVARDLLIDEGVLTKRGLSRQDRADAERGFDLVAALGRYDIGQAVIVANGRVEAIEGAEGTDRMLARAAEARRRAGEPMRGGVLVKRPKPGQDLRVDLPAIGPNTVENASVAGLSGIAVMASHVLAAERSRTVALANERDLFVAGLLGKPSLSETKAGFAHDVGSALGSVPIGQVEAAGAARAAGILATLAEFGTGSAAVIDRGRVLAVGTSESPSDVISRAARLRSPKRRRGVIVIAPSQHLNEAILRAADQSNFAGIVFKCRACDPNISQDLVRLADTLRLFVAAAKGSLAGGRGHG